MPEYFSTVFQYKMTDAGESPIENFFSNLIACGLVYKSGIWESESDSMHEILQWNQMILDERFNLRSTESSSRDFKQMLFDFRDFSEVRLFIIDHVENESFSFHLIIPEAEFIDYEESGGCKRLEHRMNIIEELALRMWNTGNMKCIQTEWECSDCETAYSDIVKGKMPLIEPFAIVPEDVYKTEWKCSCEKTGRNGVVLRNNNNWLYV